MFILICFETRSQIVHSCDNVTHIAVQSFSVQSGVGYFQFSISTKSNHLEILFRVVNLFQSLVFQRKP